MRDRGFFGEGGLVRDPKYPQTLHEGVQAPGRRALRRREAGIGDHARVRLRQVDAPALSQARARDRTDARGGQPHVRGDEAPRARARKREAPHGGRRQKNKRR